MYIFLMLFFICISFFLIAKGGDGFVEAAIKIAKKSKVPKIIIGALIVSIGTTIPETAVSIIASLKNSNELAVSNAIGSMLCNLILVLGVALTFATTVVKRKDLLLKIVLLFLNTILLIIFIQDYNINFLEGSILILIFLAFVVFNILQAILLNRQRKFNLIKEEDFEDIQSKDKREIGESIWYVLLEFLVYALMIYIGANILVKDICILGVNYLQIPSEILGVTIVAIGTSLPELVTAITAVRKKAISLSIGNVLGANIINGTFLISMCTFLNKGNLVFAIDTVQTSLIILLLGILLFTIPIYIKGKTSKWQGVLMLSMYVLYLIYLIYSITI